MNRRMIIVCCVAFAFLSVTIIGLWLNDLLYFRSFGATITLNGKASDESRIYRTANGDYLLFLEGEKAQHPVYWIGHDGRKVGIPTSQVPSSFTKSIKTGLFVACLHCPIALAEPPKFDVGTEISTTPNEINFHVSEDIVDISF